MACLSFSLVWSEAKETGNTKIQADCVTESEQEKAIFSTSQNYRFIGGKQRP